MAGWRRGRGGRGFARAILLGASVWLAAAAGQSAAAVPVQLVVSNGSARAVIDTHPFHVRFDNADTGATVLSESPAGSTPTPSASLFPVIGGPNVNGNGTTAYEALSFQEGGQGSVQLLGPASGNLAGAGQLGVLFSVGDVTAASPSGAGYRLTAATSDSSRTMTIDVTPDGSSGIRVQASLSDESSLSGFADSFVSPAGEQFHGFGGRHNAIDQAGNNLYGWPEEEAIDCTPFQAACAVVPGGGGQSFELGNGATQTYYPQNEFVSSRNYAFASFRPELTRWRMASDNPRAWQVDVAGPKLDYTVFVADTGPAAVRGLTATTGAQVRPADWAQGTTISRAIQLSMQKSTYRANILSDLRHLEQDRVDGKPLPVKDYAYEGWYWFHDDPGFIRSVNARLRALGIHPLGYLRSFVYVDNYWEDQALYNEAKAGDYVANGSDGKPYEGDSTYGFPTMQIDFSNPAAVAWWGRRVTGMLDLGFDGFMQDFGEEITTDMHFHDGETGVTMHNNYPVLYHRATREIIDAYMRAHPDRNIFFFTRSGFSGRPGSAGYENSNFPGDESPNWNPSVGLPSIIPDMLNRAVGGAVGYNTDVGGYLQLSSTTTPEIAARWSEAAALMPFYRFHLSSGLEPWDFGQQTEQIWARMGTLHDRQVGLMQKLWSAFPSTGIPPTSPLWLMYPSDSRASAVKDEWMVGSDLLVAPVIEQGASTRSVYFPAGCWSDAQSGEAHFGPRRETVAAPLAKLPYYVRCGTDPLAPGYQPPRRLPPPVARLGCGRASGALAGARLGPVGLGESRVRVRRVLGRFSRRDRRDMDFFCLRGGGIRVGFPGVGLLRGLPGRERRRVAGRAVLILTSNRRYVLAGARHGTRLAAVARRMRVLGGYRVGLNTWYIVPGHRANGIFKVRHGVIEEVGIADRRLTATGRLTWRFLRGFA